MQQYTKCAFQIVLNLDAIFKNGLFSRTDSFSEKTRVVLSSTMTLNDFDNFDN
jgi:hypothetical protein